MRIHDNIQKLGPAHSESSVTVAATAAIVTAVGTVCFFCFGLASCQDGERTGPDIRRPVLVLAHTLSSWVTMNIIVHPL